MQNLKRNKRLPSGSGVLGEFKAKTPAKDYLATLGIGDSGLSEERAVDILITAHTDMREHYSELLGQKLDSNLMKDEFQIQVTELELALDCLQIEYNEVENDLLDMWDDYYELPLWYRFITSPIENFLRKYFKSNHRYEPYKE